MEGTNPASMPPWRGMVEAHWMAENFIERPKVLHGKFWREFSKQFINFKLYADLSSVMLSHAFPLYSTQT